MRRTGLPLVCPGEFILITMFTKQQLNCLDTVFHACIEFLLKSHLSMLRFKTMYFIQGSVYGSCLNRLRMFSKAKIEYNSLAQLANADKR